MKSDTTVFVIQMAILLFTLGGLVGSERQKVHCKRKIEEISLQKDSLELNYWKLYNKSVDVLDSAIKYKTLYNENKKK